MILRVIRDSESDKILRGIFGLRPVNSPREMDHVYELPVEQVRYEDEPYWAPTFTATLHGRHVCGCKTLVARDQQSDWIRVVPHADRA